MRRLSVLVLLMTAVLLLMMINLYHDVWNAPQGTGRVAMETRPRLMQRVPCGPQANFLEEECEMCDHSFVLSQEAMSQAVPERRLGQEKMVLYRHYTGYEPWPEIQPDIATPNQVPSTVHYLWCRDAVLGFHHYLGLLSALRLLQPIKLVFHYTALPQLDHDMYYTWFLELKQSFPGLVLRPLPPGSPRCGTVEMLGLMLSLLQNDGGVFLTSNVIIARLPPDLGRSPFWFAFGPSGDTVAPSGQSHHGSSTVGVVIATQGFGDDSKKTYMKMILNAKPKCTTPEKFDKLPADSTKNGNCVVVRDEPVIYPVGIMYANSSFGQLARWLFYGTRALMFPKASWENPIPRISHMIWFSYDRDYPSEMEFYQFLTILSALHVGGFHHVYVHGNAGFYGNWWEELRKENVTFVHLDPPEMVFQQEVENPSHQSDVTRYAILHKYGGAYQDLEAMWTRRVPDWLLQFPCVATSDWAAYGLFPDGINPGVLLAKRGAPWLRYNLAAHRYYIEKNFVWNAVLMSYRTYERHPDQLFFYRHLQVMCDMGICHPSWEEGFRRDIDDRRPTIPFDWRKDTLVVHVTRPDPEFSFTSPQALAEGTDMFAQIGRNILRKSKRMDLLG